MNDIEASERESATTTDTTQAETNETTSNEQTKRERYVSRRRYLAAAGMAVGASVLAGCSQLEGGNPTDGTQTQTQTGTESGQRPGYHTYDADSLKEKYSGLKIFSGSPPNGETERTDKYTEFKTSVEDSYIRSHYDSPKLTESEHTISLTGKIQEQTDLSIASLKSDFSTETVAHTMQCAGNGRGYFEPQVAGSQWTFGAMGTAFYRGTPVSEVLDQFGVESDGYLAVMGADAPEGEDVFARSIPLSKVRKDTILAYERNGEPLTAEHGFPVRLIVPGWYGCNSVKWVNRMHVMDTMLYGEKWEEGDQRLYTHWQQYSYRILPAQDSEAKQYKTIDTFDTEAQMTSDQVKHPYMYEMLTKSFVTSPIDGATVSPNSEGTIDVLGVAWAGEDEVKQVEVSTDGGKTFSEAEFAGPHPGPTAWRMFRYEWDVTPGEYTLVSRATDENGRSQPATISKPDENLRQIQNGKYPWNRKGYGNNAYMPEAVTVTVTNG